MIEGISLTWNVHTGEGTRHPVLDVTVTIQTIIDSEKEEEVFKIILKLINRWFNLKFAHILMTELKLPEDKDKGVIEQAVLEMRPPGLVRFSPRVIDTDKFKDKLYAYYWTWFRSGGKSETDEGEKKQWEDIPTVTTWEASRRGRRPGEVEL